MTTNNNLSISERLDEFIRQNGGNERDALNVALARLDAAKLRIEALEAELNGDHEDVLHCPQCNPTDLIGGGTDVFTCMDCNSRFAVAS